MVYYVYVVWQLVFDVYTYKSPHSTCCSLKWLWLRLFASHTHDLMRNVLRVAESRKTTTAGSEWSGRLKKNQKRHSFAWGGCDDDVKLCWEVRTKRFSRILLGKRNREVYIHSPTGAHTLLDSFRFLGSHCLFITTQRTIHIVRLFYSHRLVPAVREFVADHNRQRILFFSS